MAYSRHNHCITRQNVIFPKLQSSNFRKVLPVVLDDSAFTQHPLSEHDASGRVLRSQWQTFMSPVSPPVNDAEKRRDELRVMFEEVYIAAEKRVSIIVKSRDDRRLTGEGMVDKHVSQVSDLLRMGVWDDQSRSRGWIGALDLTASYIEERAAVVADEIKSLKIPDPEPSTEQEWRALIRQWSQSRDPDKGLAMLTVARENGVQPILAILKGGPALSGIPSDLFYTMRDYTRVMVNIDAFLGLRIEAECLDAVRLACVRALSSALQESMIPPEKQAEFNSRLGAFPRVGELISTIASLDASMELRLRIPPSVFASVA